MKGFKFVSVCSVLVLSLFAGCTKIDTTDLGSELIPAIDNVETFLTSLELSTDNKLLIDSTRMLDQEPHAIGVIANDPEFGKMEATSYVSFTPTAARSYPFVKRDTVVIDSVVLSLAYVQTFGDSNAIQQFEVREIDNRFATEKFKDSLYLISHIDFAVRPEILGSAFVHFRNLKDTAVYKNGKDTLRRSGELRIKLDTSWARKFVNYDTTAGSAYNNDTIFKEQFFSGLQVRTVEGGGTNNAVAYFNINDNDRTRITFYCRIQNNGRTDTIAPYFHHTFDPQANLVRKIPGNNYLNALNNATANDEALYIQSTPGSYAEIDIQGIDTFMNTNRIVHRAELVFDRYPSTDLLYNPPPVLFIDAISADGDTAYAIRNDFVLTNANPGYDLAALGGVLRNNQYVFNLTRYVQSLVTKKLTSFKLRVYAPFYARPYLFVDNTDNVAGSRNVFVNTPIGYGRVVLYGGGSPSEKRPRLRITYSKLF